MSIDHKRARELQDTSLRALMEHPPDTRVLILDWADLTHDECVMLGNITRWIDAVVAAWERQEQR